MTGERGGSGRLLDLSCIRLYRLGGGGAYCLCDFGERRGFGWRGNWIRDAYYGKKRLRERRMLLMKAACHG